MGRIIFNAGDSNSWNPLWNRNIQAAITSDRRRYYPIPRVEVPVLLSKSIIAVYADSQTARSTWKSAGFLGQKIRTGITVGGQTDARFNGSQRVLLNQINVFNIPTVTFNPEYSLYFDVHPWHEDINFQLWEFTGNVVDSTESLIIEEIASRLIDIQLKVNDIHS